VAAKEYLKMKLPSLFPWGLFAAVFGGTNFLSAAFYIMFLLSRCFIDLICCWALG